MVHLALLGFLRHRPAHGYEIYRRLSEPDGLWRVWRIKQSQLYALLDRLEEAGAVTATIEPQESRPPRKIFRLTPAGEALFARWVEEPVPHGRELRLEFLAKLFFAWREGEETALRLIHRQAALCREWLAAEEAAAAPLRARQPYNWLVHRFRLGQIEAMLAWLEQCETVPLGEPPLPRL